MKPICLPVERFSTVIPPSPDTHTRLPLGLKATPEHGPPWSISRRTTVWVLPLMTQIGLLRAAHQTDRAAGSDRDVLGILRQLDLFDQLVARRIDHRHLLRLDRFPT